MFNYPWILVAMAAVTWALPAASAAAVQSARPLSAQEALGTFQMAPGFAVELAAAEPQVVDPVAFAFDERGRLYVAEFRGHPEPDEGGEHAPAVATIALLEDRDGDGYYETRTVFAEGLSFPNGIQPWRGGVIVTCAPDILYLKDTSGDGRADLREVMFTGFTVNNTALLTSHPTLGMDNWIHVTNGLRNTGAITSPRHPERPPVPFARADGRFRPDTWEFELTAGPGQYGLSFDDFGRRFMSSNRHPVLHAVLPPHYLARNPDLAFAQTIAEVSPANFEAKVFPISGAVTTASYLPHLLSRPHTGTFTAACGVHIFRGTALGEDARGNAFICEPAQNLVQRQVMRPAGATFASERAPGDREFMASADVWFRPVFLGGGPSGGLYVADMYRREIEHPRYFPEAIRDQFDFEAGKDRGRIYRVVSVENRGRRESGVDFSRMNAEELCAQLRSREGWRRDTAHRLLLERSEAGSAAGSLRQLLSDRAAPPEARAHALRLLEGTGALRAGDVLAGLSDPHAGVREHAMQLAEERAPNAPAILEAVLAGADDPDARVRFLCALALGSLGGEEAGRRLARIAARDGADRWARAAVFSSLRREQTDSFLRAFFATSDRDNEAALPVIRELGAMLGASGSPDASLAFVRAVLSEPSANEALRISAVAGIAASLQRRGAWRTAQGFVLGGPAEGNGAAARETQGAIGSLMARAGELALDPEVPDPERLSAIALLAFGTLEESGPVLTELLAPRQAVPIQTAAAAALARVPGVAAGAILLAPERWPAYTPAVREAVLSGIFSERRHLPSLLDAIERGDVPGWALSPQRRRQLAQQPDAAVKDRAARLLANLNSEDRMAVYENYRSVLALEADPAAGRAVYNRACSVCHVFRGEGGRVGPDLSGIGTQPAEAILLHTLVPNLEIADEYSAFLIETMDGRTLSGMIASETETSLTLRNAFGGEEVILRRDIRKMEAANASLMPNELERLMTRQELADLIRFLKEPAW